MTQTGQPSGTVGERIRGLLSERQMSQRQFAAELAGDGANTKSVENMRRQLSGWVNDDHVPSAESAKLLAEHLGVPAEWFSEPRGAGRLSLGAALQELGDVVGEFTKQAEREAARSEDAARIVQALDQRLANIEALIAQLLEGQLAGAAALEEILRRWSAVPEARGDPRSRGSSS